MAILGDVEVRVARNTSGKVVADAAGDPLQEYEVPKASSSQLEHSVEKYIEAVAGQAFQIEVYLKPDFKLFAADGVKMSLYLDGDFCGSVKYHGAASLSINQKHDKSIIFSSVRGTRDGIEVRKGISFGCLQLDENIDMGKDLADSQAQKQGRIVLEVERVTSKRLPKAIPCQSYRLHQFTLPDPVGKEIYKERHIRHAVTLGEEAECKALGPKIHDLIPYRKHGCQMLTFVFKYRDHVCLEVIGCKPREPSFAPLAAEPTMIVDDSEDAETGDGEEAIDGEVASLRAENERLRAIERENAELERKNAGLEQELASMKAIKDQMATLMGNFRNVSGTRTTSTEGIKSEIKRERIKEEPGVGRSSPPSTSTERASKRPRAYVELD